jgi:amidase/aspartyl-tRNA(Asn)/glutamyl-tRNA(Gln) amidotransferase subunit A
LITDVFDRFDFLLSPTLAINPVPNMPNGKTTVPSHINGVEIEPSIGWCLTYFLNFTGNPAASIPSGFTKDGLPVGLQIVGRRHDDRGVLSLSKFWEQLQPWIHAYPLNRK